jgi:hypothetical protein
MRHYYRLLPRVSLIPPTVHNHFHLNASQLEVNLAKPGNLERSNDISDLGKLEIENSLRNVYQTLKIYCVFVKFSMFFGLRYWPQNFMHSNILYLEYSAGNFQQCETPFYSQVLVLVITQTTLIYNRMYMTTHVGQPRPKLVLLLRCFRKYFTLP